MTSVAKDPNNINAQLTVDAFENLKIALYDGYGNPISSLGGAIDMHDACVHAQAVNVYVHQHDPVVVTAIETETAVNDYVISVDDTTGFAVGDPIDINTTTIEPTHPVIVALDVASAPGTLTLDRRLDRVHLVGDVVTKAVINLASQVGTLASPQIYFAGPPAGVIWHITNLTLAMGHNSAGDLGLFGNLPALVNGAILRVKINGNYGTLTNWKTNGDIDVDTGEVDFPPRSGGGGTYGTAANGAFKIRTEAAMILDGDTGDVFQVYVQDDLTIGAPDLLFWNMKVQGHIEGH